MGNKILLPDSCPLCDGPVHVDGVHLVCDDNCNIEAKTVYFLRAFDTKGIGPGLVSKLFEGELLPFKSNIVELIPHIVKLDSDRIAELDGAGQSLAATYASEIARIAQDGTTAEWLVSLGIPSLGWSTAESLIDHYGSLAQIVEGLTDNPESLVQMDGFGYTSVGTLTRHVHHMHDLVCTLDELGITPSEPESIEIQEDEQWTGKNIVLTGTLPNGMSRNHAADWLIQRGATIQGSVNAKTDILVAGEKAGSKLAKAESLGTQIITGNEFAAIVGAA